MSVQTTFIEQIAPIIQKYAKIYGYKVCSPVIAQACCESNFGKSSLGYKYHNYFGMKAGTSWKGKTVSLKTKEEYKQGVLTTITAKFRAYDSIEDGVKGYFDFINTKRYANLKTATTPLQYLELLRGDGYATSYTYVNTNINYIKKYNLDKYDNSSNSITVDNSFYMSRAEPKNILKGDIKQFSQIVSNIQTILNKDYSLKFVINGAVDDILIINLGNIQMSTKKSNKNLTYALQQLLKWWGANIIVDGLYGSGTKACVMNFQGIWNMSKTGTTTKDFWSMLLGKGVR